MKPIINPIVENVTRRITERSHQHRQLYLQRIDQAAGEGPHRSHLGCGNLAHSFAACQPEEKTIIKMMNQANVAIISAYNDILSAHQPLQHYPQIIKQACIEIGCTAQFAGGVPAMCDGVTQGQPGMELSLFSRDQVALSTSLALSHNLFDAVVLLGVCDKIVPGMLIGALSFGHLPAVFIPAGPMRSGLSNAKKNQVRQQYAQGNVGREELLAAESKSYHSAGTCTFYGTANSNQMLMEIMGLHLPGSSFINPATALRTALTHASAQQAAKNSQPGGHYKPLGRQLNEKALVNGIAGLLATGGSTNLTIHLIAIARAAGIIIQWQDFAELSTAVPLLARVYPNGNADVNQFHAAGGIPYIITELLSHGLLHRDVTTVIGNDLIDYTFMPSLRDKKIQWSPVPPSSVDNTILRPVSRPFDSHGGLNILQGNLGTGIIKTSSVKSQCRVIKAPAVIFNNQQDFNQAFGNGALNRDCVVVIRFQGPRCNGMPELHQLTPALGVLQDKGFQVALVTDGRMSGASGKTPAAIHLSPEAFLGGALAQLIDGDIIELDADKGILNVLVDHDEWQKRPLATTDTTTNNIGLGRELFSHMRSHVSSPETGASIFKFEDPINE